MKILLAMDDSKFSAAALRAVESHFDPRSSEVLVLHALDRFSSIAGLTPIDPSSLERLLEDERQAGEALVERARQALEAAGFRAHSATQKGDARRVILDAASRWKPDLIVLGSRGRKGLERLLIGSVSDAVARHASCSVEIVRIAEGGDRQETIAKEGGTRMGKKKATKKTKKPEK
jgi:nucleotide-binding universal stress UspA family protein